MDRLKELIKELKGIRKKEKLKIDDNILFSEGVKIFLSREIQKYKKENIKEIKKEKPTEKQKNFLIKSGYDGNIDDLSKEEAKVLIRDYIKNQKNI